MSIVSPFKQRYLFGVQPTSISTLVDFGTVTVGAEVSGSPLMKVTNFPFVNPGQQIIDQRKATGRATRLITTGSEFQLGIARPTVSLEFDANANNMSLMFWLLMQSGSSEAVGTPFIKTFIPYTTCIAEVWASLAYVVSTTTAGENWRADGGVVRSITIAGDEASQSIKATVEIAFASFAATFDASSALVADPVIESLLYKNCTIELATNPVNLPSWSLTFTNNAEMRFLDSPTALKAVLGDLGVTGEIVVPRDSGNAAHDDNALLTDLLNLTDNLLEIVFGADPSANDGDFKILINGFNTDIDKVDEIEVGWRVPIMHAYDGTNELVVTATDAIDRGIA